MIKNTIQDSKGFISSITSAVGANPALAECEHSSILSAALLGASLKLSPSPQLGQYYMVPYKEQAKAFYLKSLDLSAAMAEEQNLRESAAKIAAYNAQKQAQVPAPAEHVSAAKPATEAVSGEALQQIDFRVWVTPAQKALLRGFFKENGIKYGSVPGNK